MGNECVCKTNALTETYIQQAKQRYIIMCVRVCVQRLWITVTVVVEKYDGPWKLRVVLRQYV